MIPTRYRKRPIVIEAVRYMGSGNVDPRGAVPAWVWDAFESGTLTATNGADPLVIHTLEGPLTVAPGYWIIQGVQGELYPCKPDIFAATYEEVPPIDGDLDRRELRQVQVEERLERDFEEMDQYFDGLEAGDR